MVHLTYMYTTVLFSPHTHHLLSIIELCVRKSLLINYRLRFIKNTHCMVSDMLFSALYRTGHRSIYMIPETLIQQISVSVIQQTYLIHIGDISRKTLVSVVSKHNYQYTDT